MRIIVLSDTHMPKKAKCLPETLTKHFINADYIFHLGDWQTVDLYHQLTRYCTVVGVAGNVDNDELIEILGHQKTVEIGGYTFGLVHGHQGKGRTTETRAFNTFSRNELDVLLFGHSHIPVSKKVNNTIVFNPGSPTDKRKQSHFSFGVIEINKTLTLHHIFFR
ncbi:metallophosphoesterase [Bacillus sp. BGMRC 2118]|nr:metallophosphoesterase [Bacillus sp. BGMRC 2118]